MSRPCPAVRMTVRSQRCSHVACPEMLNSRLHRRSHEALPNRPPDQYLTKKQSTSSSPDRPPTSHPTSDTYPIGDKLPPPHHQTLTPESRGSGLGTRSDLYDTWKNARSRGMKQREYGNFEPHPLWLNPQTRTAPGTSSADGGRSVCPERTPTHAPPQPETCPSRLRFEPPTTEPDRTTWKPSPAASRSTTNTAPSSSTSDKTQHRTPPRSTSREPHPRRRESTPAIANRRRDGGRGRHGSGPHRRRRQPHRTTSANMTTTSSSNSSESLRSRCITGYT